MHARNPIHNVSTAKALAVKETLAATIDERRMMKKVAQPEHAYTGCIPQLDEPEDDPLPAKRNPPILGYKGHLRNEQDRIGTTFTKGLEVCRAPEPVSQDRRGPGARAGNQKRETWGKPAAQSKNCQPNHQVRFQTQPRAKEPKSISPRSGYGEFENASGYGEFQQRPQMSPRSGYGEFENASGYGEFQQRPQMSPRSGYGAFDSASGYGEFQKPPQMSQRSGYGAFDNASGYGEFQERPQMSGRSGYGAFENASGYGEFAAPPPENQADSPRRIAASPNRATSTVTLPPTFAFKYSDSLDKKYQQAIKSVGGEKRVLQLWQVAAASITCRRSKRTESLQSVKRSFEKREHESEKLRSKQRKTGRDNHILDLPNFLS